MLQSLTPSSKQARDEMAGLGISAYDAGGNFVGLAKFAKSLHDGLKDLSAEQRNASLKIIFGSDAVRAASVLYEQGAKGIQNWIDKTNDAGNAARTAATAKPAADAVPTTSPSASSVVVATPSRTVAS